MPTPRSWKALSPGLLAIAGTLSLMLAILIVARPGALHGDTIRLHVAVREARGLSRGSQVWLNGKPIGKVERIGFSPASVDTTHRVLLEIRVLERHRAYLRHDAPVQIASGGTLIGAPVVQFGAGTPSARAVADGDTLRARPRVTLATIGADVSLATRELPAIIGNVKLLGAQLRSTRGTLGALGMEQEGTPLEAARSSASRIGARLSGGRGTVGRLLEEREALTARASRAMARADSVRALLASDVTSLGRFRRDSTLLRTVADIRNELSIVQAQLEGAYGTAGRLRRDEALTQEVAAAQHEMGVLFADIKARPLRYVRF